MWVRAALLGILAFLTVFLVSSLIQYRGQASRDGSASAGVPPGESRGGRELVQPQQPVPVSSNRGPDVLDGFRGDVHPLLFGATRLEVTAQWTPVGKGRDRLHRDLNPVFYSWFTNLRPARPRQTYTERDLSAFLPQTVGEPGQLWALDADKMAAILRQFHPRPSMHLVASGRRAGPDGAFAILRAISPAYLDIVIRVHAEFYLTPDDWRSPDNSLIRAWYTPAYFAGRVLVNRQAGTVDHFQLALTTEKSLNVHLTVENNGTVAPPVLFASAAPRRAWRAGCAGLRSSRRAGRRSRTARNIFGLMRQVRGVRPLRQARRLSRSQVGDGRGPLAGAPAPSAARLLGLAWLAPSG